MRFVLIIGLMWVLTACKADETISGYTKAKTVWVLTELDGVAFNARATLAFPSKGRTQGHGPCNRFSASQNVPLPWIEIENIAATKMACDDLNAETQYFSALTDMTLAEVAGTTMILSNDAGREMVFRTAP